MIPQISKALSSGFTSSQIINFLIKKFPDHKDKIKSAQAAGYTFDQILRYISGGKKALNEISEGTTEFEQMRNKDIQKRENINKGALQAGGLAASALAAPMAASALQRALPASLGSLIPSLTSESQSQTPTTESQQPPVNQVAPTITQNAQVPQPEGISNSKEYLEKLGIKDQVDSLLAADNTPEQVATAIGLKGGRGRLKAGIDPELVKNIESYAQTAQQTQQANQGVEPAGAKLVEAQETPEVILTPHGVGEIVTSRNGKAIVDVDGKKHQVEEKSLLKPPREAAIEALELIKSFTPEQQRSTHHMLNSYDEQEKKAFFVFHNGTAYVVDDISPEEYKELSEEVADAKTSGETIIGKWAAGEGSRGAGYNKVVKGHRERKVVPELKKKYRKLKVGYNLLSEWQRLLNEKD